LTRGCGKSAGARGIATGIPLQVDSLWPEWICALSLSCSGKGRFRLRFDIPTWHPKRPASAVDSLEAREYGRDTKSDIVTFRVEGAERIGISHRNNLA
jgi:hypothetical protein